MKNSEIHILHTTISPCDNERRIFNEAFTAISHGYQVEIVALKTPDLPEESETDQLKIIRLSVKHWEGGPLKFLSFNWKIFRYLLKKKPAIIHAHDLWVLPASAAASLFTGGRLIYDAHEYFAGLEIFNIKKWSGRIWILAERMLIGKVDSLITINRFHQKLFLKLYPDIPDSAVIMNVPSLQHGPKTENMRSFDERDNCLLYQGIFKEGRSLPVLIRSMHLVWEGRLDLIGFGDLEKRLREMVAEEGLENKIYFRGRAGWQTILEETQRARAGLVLFEPTSVNYTFASPNKFFEYVMAGTPVIASDIPAFRELNSIFEVGILVRLDGPEAISRAMKVMLTDRESWQKFHENCLDARKVWNWEKQEDMLMDIYRKLGLI